MSLFIIGLGLTVSAPALCRNTFATRGPHWVYSLGCMAAVLGPYLLLCTLFDVLSVLLSCTVLGGAFWINDRLRVACGKARYTHGVLGFAVDLTPIALLLLLVRGFVGEAYIVPSSSMRPTLPVGNVVLVEKLSYGARLPLVSSPLFSVSSPQRGDVMVFRFPLDKTKPYIKRVVGLPGDLVIYSNGRLSVNSQAIDITQVGEYEYRDEQSGRKRVAHQMSENLFGARYNVLQDSPSNQLGRGSDFPEIQGCTRTLDGISCRVPASRFFVLGDNRANSLDSRYWGFVSDDEVIGRAILSCGLGGCGGTSKTLAQ